MRSIIFLFLFLSFSNSWAQQHAPTSSQLYKELQNLSNTATIMYIAAHPDDENTRLISWLTNEKHVNTIYLSLTRGDGGQNLIGTEKGPLLGLLRTQELLEAREVDGGKQWFSRANDFGYSKTATETFTIWDEQELLSDVVWAIRKHRPDILITRFHPDSNGETHGHHTASAILTEKAFDLAADETAFPNQLSEVSTWQPKRLFFNTSWWFYGSRDAFEKADKSNMLFVDVGTYFPLLGQSNNEIAALSRSKHACQGFGAELQRGSQIEWLELLKGDMPTNGDLLQGINTSFENEQLNQLIDQALKQFSFRNPSESVPDLIAIAKEMQTLPESDIKQEKLRQVHRLILKANGVYTEWVTQEAYAVDQSTIATTIEITNRGLPITVRYPLSNKDTTAVLQYNESVNDERLLDVNKPSITTPYWLEEPMQHIGMYTVTQLNKRGLPQQDPPLHQAITVSIEDYSFEVAIPLQHKTIDPAKGEMYEPFYIVPPVAANITNSVYLFANEQPQTISVDVTSFRDSASGTVSLHTDNDWVVSKPKPFSIEKKGGTQRVQFSVTPPEKQLVDQLEVRVQLDENTYQNSFELVDYPHIDKQFVFRKEQAVIQKINMGVPAVSVGYIQGSGDEVPQALRQIGVAVTELTEDQWTFNQFSQYDVIMVGIRAFNTLETLPYATDQLWRFAEQGGTVIVQYNTNRGLKTDNIAPYNLTLSRDRIAEEDAELTILQPTHPLVNYPNKITQKDFEDWVQERGLYFAGDWSDDFTPILSGHDTGETAKQGMLLVADVGKGHYIYTGLSFFRELPAGVPGAYRLMMNLLALGEADEQ